MPSRFLFSGLRFVLFNTFVPAVFFLLRWVFSFFYSLHHFFFSCATATYLSINSIPTFCHRSQPKLHETNFNCHLITAFWNHRIQSLKYRLFNSDSEKISYWSSNELVYKKVQKLSFIFLLPELPSFCPMTLIKLLKPLSRINERFYFSLLGICRQQ